jgi:hypothetical protein
MPKQVRIVMGRGMSSGVFHSSKQKCVDFWKDTRYFFKRKNGIVVCRKSSQSRSCVARAFHGTRPGGRIPKSVRKTSSYSCTW